MKNNSHCDIYFIRHGETDWNKEGILQGHTDISLNDNGRMQALQLKEKFKHIKFTKNFSSDLSRAGETASIVLDHSSIIKTPLLRERKMGSWEGLPANEFRAWVKEKSISTDAFKSKENYLSHKWQPDIESYDEVYKRVSTLILNVLDDPDISGPVLCSTHGGVLCALLHILNDNFSIEQHWQIENCAYIILRANKDKTFSLVTHNGISLIKSPFVPF